MAGECKFDDELLGRIDPEDSYWSLGDKKDDERTLTVSLVKCATKKPWRCVGKKQAEELQKKTQEEGGMQPQLMCFNDLNPDDDNEIADKNEHDEKVLEEAFLKLRKEKGLADPVTLRAFFALFDNSIQLYHLNMLETYLEDIVPICRKRSDELRIRGIQAWAFV